MNRDDAYKILADRLELFRCLGHAALELLVNEPVVSETFRLNGEDIVVEVAVAWEDKKHGTLRISATAFGPSTCMTERFTERIIVRPAGG